ncbi:hypothetical protein CB1_001599008 [Camelus ferus]|nr:hypothetical protein CB1_001599008 [Camelus ferus]
MHETPKSNEQLNRRSQRLQQLTEVSTRSLRSREIQGQVQIVKQSLPSTRKDHCSNTQSKSNKVKTNQKHVKRKVLEIKSDSKEDENSVINEVINSPKGKKRKVEHQTAYPCSSQCIKGSEKCLQKNTRKEETKPVPVTTSEIKRSKVATSVVSKKNEMKKSVHTQVNTSAKSQKSSQPSVPEQSVDKQLEQAGKSKRGSILQLCEEIAGEIESDTVEVKKESSQMENIKEEKPTEIKLEETDTERQILHQKEINQDVQCNRFFPSRKTKPVKCILNGINSSTKKNSNWTKIKLSKFNSVQQNKLDSQIAPKLGLLQTSFSLPALEMHHPVTHGTFLGSEPHDDKNKACQREEMKEINSEEVKINDTTVEINSATKRPPENCHLDNQIKPPPDPPLDNQMKDSFQSTPDKGWKKERILAEYPDGRIIMVLPEDPKYALKKGYRVIEEKLPVIRSEEEKVRFERQKAWCCSTLPEPAICGISRIWVFSMMRRKKIASRMIECLRSNFIYGSYLSKEEIAFSDPTPDGKLFATQYCGTGQFLVYNFINGQNST